MGLSRRERLGLTLIVGPFVAILIIGLIVDFVQGDWIEASILSVLFISVIAGLLLLFKIKE